MKAVVWIGVLLCLSPVQRVSAAPYKNYYETRVLQLPKRMPSRDLRADILAGAKAQNLRRIDVKKADGTTVTLFPKTGLNTPVSQQTLLSLSMALGTQLVGAEVDLLLSINDTKKQPLTLHWDVATRRIQVLVGEPMTAFSFNTRLSPQIRRTGQTTFTGNGWTTGGRRLVNAALARLSKTERAFVQDVPFARQNKPSAKLRGRVQTKDRRYRTMNAVYSEDASGARVVVFDSTFDEIQQFAGPITAPQPASLLTLVHEMAHGFARHPARKQMDAHRRLHRKFERQRAAFNRDVKERNQFAKAKRRETTKEIVQQLKSWDSRLTSQQRTLVRLKKSLKRSQVSLEQSAGRESRAARALGRVLKDVGRAPTLYGRLSMEEAFAECFALYHVDPEALVRTAPQVYAWFQRGGHIEAVRAELKGFSLD